MQCHQGWCPAGGQPPVWSSFPASSSAARRARDGKNATANACSPAVKESTASYSLLPATHLTILMHSFDNSAHVICFVEREVCFAHLFETTVNVPAASSSTQHPGPVDRFRHSRSQRHCTTEPWPNSGNPGRSLRCAPTRKNQFLLFRAESCPVRYHSLPERSFSQIWCHETLTPEGGLVLRL